MRADAIAVGDTLRMKRMALESYGPNATATVTVSEVRERIGFLTPWIVARNESGILGHYRPSDFENKVTR